MHRNGDYELQAARGAHKAALIKDFVTKFWARSTQCLTFRISPCLLGKQGVKFLWETAPNSSISEAQNEICVCNCEPGEVLGVKLEQGGLKCGFGKGRMRKGGVPGNAGQEEIEFLPLNPWNNPFFSLCSCHQGWAPANSPSAGGVHR